MKKARITFVRAAIAAVLSGILSVEPALISAAQSDMWAERRKAMLAPAHTETATNPSDSLLASLPAISNPVMTGTGIKNTAAGLARLDLKGAVPEWIQTAVTPFATIQTARLSAGDQRPTVVMVQDAHLHNEAQHHIGGVIESLGKESAAQGDRLLVGLEGAPAGPIDLSPYRGDSENIAKEVAWALESVSMLSGAEAAAISNLGTKAAPKQLVNLVGTEDFALYKANVAALREAVPFEKSAKAALSDLRRELVELKKKQFDPELIRFDGRKDAYEQGTLSLPDYALYLDSVVTATASNLRELIEAALIEGSLKFDRVETERKKLLAELIPKLSDKELKELLQASVLFRAGQLTYSGYYDQIKGLSSRHGLPLSKFPEMNIYIQYVLKSEAIDHRKLFEEVRELETAVQAHLASTDAQRAVLSLDSDYHLMVKLVDRALIESEWHAYEARLPEVDKLLDRLAAAGGGRPQTLVDMAPKWATFGDFYAAALKRNIAMTDNFAAAIEKTGARHAVIVAGGFHSEGLAALLEKKNLNVLVLSPKITKTSDGPSSLDFLAAGRLPLDEIFSGQKLFLPTEMVTATQPKLVEDLFKVGAPAVTNPGQQATRQASQTEDVNAQVTDAPMPKARVSAQLPDGTFLNFWMTARSSVSGLFARLGAAVSGLVGTKAASPAVVKGESAVDSTLSDAAKLTGQDPKAAMGWGRVRFVAVAATLFALAALTGLQAAFGITASGSLGLQAIIILISAIALAVTYLSAGNQKQRVTVLAVGLGAAFLAVTGGTLGVAVLMGLSATVLFTAAEESLHIASSKAEGNAGAKFNLGTLEVDNIGDQGKTATRFRGQLGFFLAALIPFVGAGVLFGIGGVTVVTPFFGGFLGLVAVLGLTLFNSEAKGWLSEVRDQGLKAIGIELPKGLRNTLESPVGYAILTTVAATGAMTLTAAAVASMFSAPIAATVAATVVVGLLGGALFHLVNYGLNSMAEANPTSPWKAGGKLAGAVGAGVGLVTIFFLPFVAAVPIAIVAGLLALLALSFKYPENSFTLPEMSEAKLIAVMISGVGGVIMAGSFVLLTSATTASLFGPALVIGTIAVLAGGAVIGFGKIVARVQKFFADRAKTEANRRFVPNATVPEQTGLGKFYRSLRRATAKFAENQARLGGRSSKVTQETLEGVTFVFPKTFEEAMAFYLGVATYYSQSPVMARLMLQNMQARLDRAGTKNPVWNALQKLMMDATRGADKAPDQNSLKNLLGDLIKSPEGKKLNDAQRTLVVAVWVLARRNNADLKNADDPDSALDKVLANVKVELSPAGRNEMFTLGEVLQATRAMIGASRAVRGALARFVGSNGRNGTYGRIRSEHIGELNDAKGHLDAAIAKKDMAAFGRALAETEEVRTRFGYDVMESLGQDIVGELNGVGEPKQGARDAGLSQTLATLLRQARKQAESLARQAYPLTNDEDHRLKREALVEKLIGHMLEQRTDEMTGSVLEWFQGSMRPGNPILREAEAAHRAFLAGAATVVPPSATVSDEEPVTALSRDEQAALDALKALGVETEGLANGEHQPALERAQRLNALLQGDGSIKQTPDAKSNLSINRARKSIENLMKRSATMSAQAVADDLNEIIVDYLHSFDENDRFYEKARGQIFDVIYALLGSTAKSTEDASLDPADDAALNKPLDSTNEEATEPVVLGDGASPENAEANGRLKNEFGIEPLEEQGWDANAALARALVFRDALVPLMKLDPGVLTRNRALAGAISALRDSIRDGSLTEAEIDASLRLLVVSLGEEFNQSRSALVKAAQANIQRFLSARPAAVPTSTKSTDDAKLEGLRRELASVGITGVPDEKLQIVATRVSSLKAVFTALRDANATDQYTEHVAAVVQTDTPSLQLVAQIVVILNKVSASVNLAAPIAALQELLNNYPPPVPSVAVGDVLTRADMVDAKLADVDMKLADTGDPTQQVEVTGFGRYRLAIRGGKLVIAAGVAVKPVAKPSEATAADKKGAKPRAVPPASMLTGDRKELASLGISPEAIATVAEADLPAAVERGKQLGALLAAVRETPRNPGDEPLLLSAINDLEAFILTGQGTAGRSLETILATIDAVLSAPNTFRSKKSLGKFEALRAELSNVRIAIAPAATVNTGEMADVSALKDMGFDDLAGLGIVGAEKTKEVVANAKPFANVLKAASAAVRAAKYAGAPTDIGEQFDALLKALVQRQPTAAIDGLIVQLQASLVTRARTPGAIKENEGALGKAVVRLVKTVEALGNSRAAAIDQANRAELGGFGILVTSVVSPERVKVLLDRARAVAALYTIAVGQNNNALAERIRIAILGPTGNDGDFSDFAKRVMPAFETIWAMPGVRNEPAVILAGLRLFGIKQEKMESVGKDVRGNIPRAAVRMDRMLALQNVFLYAKGSEYLNAVLKLLRLDDANEFEAGLRELLVTANAARFDGKTTAENRAAADRTLYGAGNALGEIDSVRIRQMDEADARVALADLGISLTGRKGVDVLLAGKRARVFAEAVAALKALKAMIEAGNGDGNMIRFLQDKLNELETVVLTGRTRDGKQTIEDFRYSIAGGLDIGAYQAKDELRVAYGRAQAAVAQTRRKQTAAEESPLSKPTDRSTKKQAPVAKPAAVLKLMAAFFGNEKAIPALLAAAALKNFQPTQLLYYLKGLVQALGDIKLDPAIKGALVKLANGKGVLNADQLRAAILPILAASDEAAELVFNALGMNVITGTDESRALQAEAEAMLGRFVVKKGVNVRFQLIGGKTGPNFSFVTRDGKNGVLIRISEETIAALAAQFAKRGVKDQARARQLALQHLLIKEIAAGLNDNPKEAEAAMKGKVNFADAKDGMAVNGIPASSDIALLEQVGRVFPGLVKPSNSGQEVANESEATAPRVFIDSVDLFQRELEPAVEAMVKGKSSVEAAYIRRLVYGALAKANGKTSGEAVADALKAAEVRPTVPFRGLLGVYTMNLAMIVIAQAKLDALPAVNAAPVNGSESATTAPPIFIDQVKLFESRVESAVEAMVARKSPGEAAIIRRLVYEALVKANGRTSGEAVAEALKAAKILPSIPFNGLLGDYKMNKAMVDIARTKLAALPKAENANAMRPGFEALLDNTIEGIVSSLTGDRDIVRMRLYAAIWGRKSATVRDALYAAANDLGVNVNPATLPADAINDAIVNRAAAKYTEVRARREAAGDLETRRALAADSARAARVNTAIDALSSEPAAKRSSAGLALRKGQTDAASYDIGVSFSEVPGLLLKTIFSAADDQSFADFLAANEEALGFPKGFIKSRPDITSQLDGLTVGNVRLDVDNRVRADRDRVSGALSSYTTIVSLVSGVYNSSARRDAAVNDLLNLIVNAPDGTPLWVLIRDNARKLGLNDAALEDLRSRTGTAATSRDLRRAVYAYAGKAVPVGVGMVAKRASSQAKDLTAIAFFDNLADLPAALASGIARSGLPLANLIAQLEGLRSDANVVGKLSGAALAALENAITALRALEGRVGAASFESDVAAAIGPLLNVVRATTALFAAAGQTALTAGADVDLAGSVLTEMPALLGPEAANTDVLVHNGDLENVAFATLEGGRLVIRIGTKALDTLTASLITAARARGRTLDPLAARRLAMQTIITHEILEFRFGISHTALRAAGMAGDSDLSGLEKPPLSLGEISLAVSQLKAQKAYSEPIARTISEAYKNFEIKRFEISPQMKEMIKRFGTALRLERRARIFGSAAIGTLVVGGLAAVAAATVGAAVLGTAALATVLGVTIGLAALFSLGFVLSKRAARAAFASMSSVAPAKGATTAATGLTGTTAERSAALELLMNTGVAQPILRQIFDAIRSRNREGNAFVLPNSNVSIEFNDQGTLTSASITSISQSEQATVTFRDFLSLKGAQIGTIESDGIQRTLGLGDTTMEAYDSATSIDQAVRSLSAFLADPANANKKKAVLAFSTEAEFRAKIVEFIAFAKAQKKPIDFNDQSPGDAVARAEAVLGALDAPNSRIKVVGLSVRDAAAFTASLDLSPTLLASMRATAEAFTGVTTNRTVVFSARQLAMAQIDGVMQVMVLSLYQSVNDQIKAAAIVAIQA